MDIKLSLPKLAPDPSNNLKTKPADVTKWLENLPVLDIAETSHELHKTLMGSNRCQLDSDTRLTLLELYSEPIRQVSEKLYKGYSGLPLPLSDRHQVAAEQVRHFQIEMAYGYKRVVDDRYSRNKPKISARRAAKIALPVQRAIRYLTNSLVHSYQQYTPYPVGTWKEIHMLYQLAETYGMTELPVDDKLNTSIPHSSISHAYKQALLIDLSDPYHLPAQMIIKINRYLDLMAPLAQVHQPPITAVADNCQFLVDLNSDHAGHMVVGKNDNLKKNHLRLLNTIDLARAIHRQLTSLEKGKPPQTSELGDDFFDSTTNNMFRRLINSWGVNPKRLFKRVAKINTPIEAAIGLSAASYFLNRGRKFRTSAEFMGPKPQRNRIGTLFARPDDQADDIDSKNIDDSQQQHEISDWGIVDESAGGMALEIAGSIETHIRVGEIIITRAPDEKTDWTINVIRWMRRLGNNHMEIGIQKLAPSAAPLAIKTIDFDNKESEFMAGLLLPEIGALKQHQSLLTPRGIFKNDGVIYLDDGKMLRRATGGQLMEATGSYERFEFEFQRF